MLKEKCSQCDGITSTWEELTVEEREVVKRLPASTEYSEKERQTHRWCTRCWNESVKTEPDLA